MRFIIFSLTFFLPFSVYSQLYSIEGKVLGLTTKKPVGNLAVRLYYEDYSKVDTLSNIVLINEVSNSKKDIVFIEPKLIMVDSTWTDVNGNFCFYSIKEGFYTVYCRIRKVDKGYQIDSRNHVNVSSDSVFVKLTPKIYCEYEKYRNQDYCPVCFKKNNISKVEYGLPLYGLKNPDKILSKKDEYWIGYCDKDPYCYARWYCRKCKKLF